MRVPELLFFIGKGGVGKTTVSAACAVYRALTQPTRRVLLISTDPAHSLADVLQLRLANSPTPVGLPKKAKLHAWQVSAEREFRKFIRQNREALLQTIESGSIFTRDEIEPLLDTSLPGMAEMSGLLAINHALRTGQYDSIVVDTAPLGHTLRLFGLPQQFARFLNFVDIAGSRDRVLAQHFGARQIPPQQFVADWRTMLTDLEQTVSRDAQIFLVTTSERFALQESLRSTAELRGSSPPIETTAIVLNRAAIQSSKCPICRQQATATRKARTVLRKHFHDTVIHIAEDRGTPILGSTNLAAFGAHVFAGKKLKLNITAPFAGADLKLQSARWPALQNPLSFVIGKGGVGKTTVAAALGFRTRAQQRRTVTICSVDPAPSLDDVFQQDVGDQATPVVGDARFRAMELDAQSDFTRWLNGINDKIDEALTSDVSGVHVDLSFERRLLSALLDIVPPGVDEVFAVFRILDLLAQGSNSVIIDMAPTGHALELLRMPDRMLLWSRLLLKTLSAHRRLALARDLAVEIAQFGQRARELLSRLKNSKRTSVWTVMLAEPLPDSETARLLKDVQQLQLPRGPLVVNRLLFPEDVGSCLRCNQARRWQLATIARLRQRYRKHEIYAVRNFPVEIAGKQRLRAFTSELWRLA
jgi:arsenite-transporting ATPase